MQPTKEKKHGGREGIVQVLDADGVKTVRFLRGGIRDEREILKTLQDLAHEVEAGKPVRLILNLEKIEYLCSAGLGSLVALLKKVRVSNGELKLCCLNDSVRELFELMLLTRIFEIFETEELARKSF